MNKKAFIPISALIGALLLALVAAMTPFVAEHNLAYAQTADSTVIEYAENGEGPVATFTATDPEGAMPIAWFLGTDSIDGVDTADVADNGHFDIDDETGVLTFDVGGDTDTPDVSVSPDFENPPTSNDTDNTYKVVVAACDVALEAGGTCGGNTGYHKVTVEVTNVNEPGKIDLVATNPADGTSQYLVGQILTATASDGDITGTQTFTDSSATGVSGVIWRWYRGGAVISGTDAQDNTYTLTADDVGQHIRAVVYYIVVGNVDQEMAEKTTDYPVLAARVGANQLEFDPATVSMTISEGDKDRNVGAPVTAMGNHGTVRYSLDDSGDDDRFKIDEKTGQITTTVELDYEGESVATATAAGSCVDAAAGSPDRECTVTVIAIDSTGDSTTGTDPNFRATVTIMITDVDEMPVFSTGSQMVSVPENNTDLWHASTSGYTETAETGVTYTAMDPEGRTVNYSLAGPDASKFQLKGSNPVLSFVSAPDFEAKASADGDNVYEVTVRASVGGDTGERMVRVTVGEVDEGLDVSGPSTMSFVENGEGPVATFTATDPEGAMPIAWFLGTDSIDGVDTADVADNGHFDIDDETGVLTFDVGGDTDTPDVSVSPDFENPPTSNDTDNTYKVVVAACDVALEAGGTCGGNTGYHKVTVEVTNVNEPGKIDLVATNPADGTSQYLVGQILTATASDGDITGTQTFTDSSATGVSGVTWRWYRGGAVISGTDAQDNTYTLTADDVNNRIRATVTYRVGTNTNLESASRTTDYPVLAARVGANQLEFDPATVSMTISEGDKDRNVGAPVTAMGNHGTVRYSLDDSGDDDRFKIDEKTGQITTTVELDYEGESVATATAAGSCVDAAAGSPDRECTVTVIAIDSTGDSTTGTDPNFRATVTIMITDVDEMPVFSTGSQMVSVPENNTDLWHASTSGYTETAETGVTYTAMDPEGRTVNYSLAGPDASKFQLKGSNPVLSFVSAPDFEAKASADGDNVYEVTVRASVGGDTGERMVRVTVGEVDEGLMISAGASIRGQSSISYAENGTDDVASYEVVGLATGATVGWSLSGDDAGEFDISSSGVLTFASPPDFEGPADDNTDNVYEVTVMAGDGTDSAMLNVRVTVTDVENDMPAGLDLLTRYDADRSGHIDLSEVNAAIDDYFNGDLTLEEVNDVIDLYFM